MQTYRIGCSKVPDAYVLNEYNTPQGVKCPLFSHYDSETDQCRSTLCPDTMRASETGKCQQCGPYQYGGYLCYFYKYLSGIAVSKFATLSHCKLLENGEFDSYFDDLG